MKLTRRILANWSSYYYLILGISWVTYTLSQHFLIAIV